MGDELNFKTNIQLKSIIGKDLINDDNIAILELVKNAFDADAKKVSVNYINLKENDDSTTPKYSNKTSRLIIQDDGLGMDLDDIRNKWLNIAYSEKKSNNKQHNRRMAGAKGVGRFSCDRLGEYLNLYAKTSDGTKYIQLKIDWKLFEVEDENKEIQSVTLEHHFLTDNDLIELNIAPFTHGVLLEIIKLRSNWATPNKDKQGLITDWNTDKLVQLKQYLEKLINPNQAFEDNDFGIYMDAPEFVKENTKRTNHEKFIGKVENRIFEKLDFKSTSIETEIQDDGKVIYTILKDKGKTIFWIKEKNIYFPFIKNTQISLYYLNPYAKAFFTKQTGIQSVNYGSIFLFINGFRIPPYGELGDDWLGLDQRKNQGTARFIGLRELIGRIEILDEHNDFQIISSREGIVKNESYVKLTNSKQNDSLFFRTLRRLEKYVVDGLSWDSFPEEMKDYFKEVEKKIISGETTEDQLVFREEESVKRKRVYESIHSIIGAKAENVIELYINETLILDKIAEEKNNSEREFEQLLQDIENKNIAPETISRILLRKAEQNKELEKQINDFSKYSINEVTSKAILELQLYKQLNESQLKAIETLQKQLEASNNDYKSAKEQLEQYKKEREEAIQLAETERKKRVEAESEKEKAVIVANKALAEKEELEVEKEKQILFHQKLLTKEVIDLLEYHHIIGISADTIEKHLVNVQDDLVRNKIPSKEDLLDLIESVSYESKKIISLTNLATSANFSADADEIDTDLVQFIKQYAENLRLRTFDSNSMKIEVLNADIEFEFHFKPIEMAIIFDNLFSNSRKAKATEILVSFSKKNDQLTVIVRDNGKNVIKKDNQDKLFDFGFTTTSGSGMGLHHVRTLLSKYKGGITYNKEVTNGAEFLIQFKK